MYICIDLYVRIFISIIGLSFFFSVENTNCGAGWKDHQTTNCMVLPALSIFRFSFFITDNFFLKHDFFEVGFSNLLIETVTLLTGIGCLFFLLILVILFLLDLYFLFLVHKL